MTVPDSTSEVFVWAWLPGSAAPVPCGVLRPAGSRPGGPGSRFRTRSARAVSLSPDLPLWLDWFGPVADLPIPGTTRGLPHIAVADRSPARDKASPVST